MRDVPRLLFITHRERLASCIGHTGADRVIQEVTVAGHSLIDINASLVTTVSTAQCALERSPTNITGVVLLGGYQVLPAQRLDCLPARVRRNLGHAAARDADNFIVWSDDAYGDTNRDGWPELAVTRVPDAGDCEFMLKILNSNRAYRQSSRFGLRNTHRPFADAIFKSVAGCGEMLLSLPTTTTSEPLYDATADVMYLMLHGSERDATRFWGEPINDAEALALANVPTRAPHVVFTGCCWGALIVDLPAVIVRGNLSPRTRQAHESLALTFLQRGATAFVGCTGSHYSPAEHPFGYAGAPLHKLFWRFYQSIGSPARALLAAKQQYMTELPHGRTSPADEAVEYKILREYTCLGLGW